MKALTSFGTGSYAEMLEIARPSFQDFADRHGYTLVTPTEISDERPPSWMKIPLFLDLLDRFDEVLWVDADAVIVDTSEDIQVPEGFWQALVLHWTPDGYVPSCGTWLLRPEMRETLKRAWEMTEYMNHPWWEQAAISELLGFAPSARPMMQHTTTPLSEKTFWLDNGWSVHPNDITPVKTRRVMQATPGQDRVAAMREWAAVPA